MKLFDKNTYRNFNWWKSKLKLAIINPNKAFVTVNYYLKRFIADQKSRFGIYRNKYKIIFIAGMALSGTTWMKNLLARVPSYFTRGMPMPYDIAYSQGICDSAFCKVPKYGYSLFKTHLNPDKDFLECIFRNGVEKIVVVHRDIRDIVLSRYYRLIKYPKPKDAYDFVNYESLGFEKAVDHSIDLVNRSYKNWILGWLANKEKYPEKIIIIKFEDMKLNTAKEFKKVLDFYEIKMTDKNINKIVEECRGKKTQDLTSSSILPWGLSSNFRSGKIGEWKKEMNPKQKKRCKELFGDTLIKTGYEKDLNW
tara:strand:- start:2315 stop:3238 length:924 start_codon:yes stop_codon:yes gene_type:complete